MNKKPYVPKEFPPDNINWEALVALIGEANRGIALFEGLLQGMVNPELLLSPLTTNEAVLSSRIEGTQATFEDVAKEEAGIASPEISEAKRLDIKEIINYREALKYGEEELKRRGALSLSLIKEIQKMLLTGTRGKDKLLGEFRKKQNFIGPPGISPEKATFVPPEPIVMRSSIEEWQKFLSTNDFPDKLVQLALLHAQFEILHPFEDGNGRTGRILIPLFLYQKGLLSRPSFYLSEYFEEHRDEYYDRLLFITERDDWQGWIEFFLKAVKEQANSNIAKAKELHNLYEDRKDKFIKATRSQYAVPALDAFFMKPLIDTTSFLTLVKSPRRTGIELLNKLLEADLIYLYTPSKGRIPAVYALCEILNIVENKKIC